MCLFNTKGLMFLRNSINLQSLQKMIEFIKSTTGQLRVLQWQFPKGAALEHKQEDQFYAHLQVQSY